MARLVDIHRSIFTQIVAWAILIAALITFGLWLLTDTTIQRTNHIALERAVDVDLAGMVDIFASGGAVELSNRINDRLALQPRDANPAHYLLADAKGTPLAGDVRAWPGLHAGVSETGEIVLPDGERALARATQLGPDLRLMVAHEYRDLGLLLRQVALAFLAGGLLAVGAVALAGWLAAQRLAGRIERINAAFRHPDDAALAQLAKGSKDRDEIDELTRHSGDALARLRRLASAQRETTDQVAHEMRTPLMHLDNRLVRALATLPANGSAGDAGSEAAARITDARLEIRSIIRMLESLLDIAASQARRGDRHGLAQVDLSALAERLAELYADSAEESGHAFELAIEPGVTLEGEEMQLTRLITNLLDNAFKFVPPGGTVRLELAKGPRLTVRDDGPGVPEPDRHRIFDKFSRAGNHDGHGGAGLGLALCRAIAERHHLEIKLVPSEKGACFTIAPESKS